MDYSFSVSRNIDIHLDLECVQKAEARGDERSVTPKENWVASNPCNGFQDAMQVLLYDSSLYTCLYTSL